MTRLLLTCLVLACSSPYTLRGRVTNVQPLTPQLQFVEITGSKTEWYLLSTRFDVTRGDSIWCRPERDENGMTSAVLKSVVIRKRKP